MKIVKYNSEEEVIKQAIEYGLTTNDIVNSYTSYSFRIFNTDGSTKEFHVFYKK